MPHARGESYTQVPIPCKRCINRFIRYDFIGGKNSIIGNSVDHRLARMSESPSE